MKYIIPAIGFCIIAAIVGGAYALGGGLGVVILVAAWMVANSNRQRV